MRKMRALVALGFALLVTPMLMGAKISLDKVTPNPGAVNGTMSASGTWSVDTTAGETFVGIQFTSYLKGTQQFVGGPGTPAGGNWTASLSSIGAGTYNPSQVILYFNDAKGNPQQTAPVKNTLDQVVK